MDILIFVVFLSNYHRLPVFSNANAIFNYIAFDKMVALETGRLLMGSLALIDLATYTIGGDSVFASI